MGRGGFDKNRKECERSRGRRRWRKRKRIKVRQSRLTWTLLSLSLRWISQMLEVTGLSLNAPVAADHAVASAGGGQVATLSTRRGVWASNDLYGTGDVSRRSNGRKELIVATFQRARNHQSGIQIRFKLRRDSALWSGRPTCGFLLLVKLRGRHGESSELAQSSLGVKGFA